MSKERLLQHNYGKAIESKSYIAENNHLWRNLILQDFFPSMRMLKIVDDLQQPMKESYKNLISQRRLFTYYFREVNRNAEYNYALQKKRETFRVFLLFINTLFLWFCVPALLFIQNICFIFYCFGIIHYSSLCFIPLYLMILLILGVFILNTVVFVNRYCKDNESILFGQWDHIGYTIVRLVYADIYRYHSSSFIHMFICLLSIISVVVLLTLKFDNSTSVPWLSIFIIIWVVPVYLLLSLPVKQWDEGTRLIYRLLIYGFGGSLYILSILLYISLDIYSLPVSIIFIPIFILDLALTIFVGFPSIVEFIKQVIYKNIKEIQDTLGLLCFYLFGVLPGIISQVLLCYQSIPSGYSFIILFVFYGYLATQCIRTSIHSYILHQYSFSFL
ncbi:hypothetical protein WA158_001093 [Blastocystis sp. Blastoise]